MTYADDDLDELFDEDEYDEDGFEDDDEDIYEFEDEFKDLINEIASDKEIFDDDGILEETGIDVSKAEGGYSFCYHRENKGQNYIVDIYRFEMDISEKDIKLQTDEDIDGRFASAEEIKALSSE